MSSSSSSPAMVWDPKAPSSLIMPSVKEGKLEFTKFYANDGIGAHAVETSALLQILTASPSHKSYRRILDACIDEFQQADDRPSFESLELLKLLYAVTHLTETHVLQTPTMADTIPYLRHHHMETVDIGELLEKTRHPEERKDYWIMLRQLVIRGCLSDAWGLLTYHSACQRAYSSDVTLDAYHASQRETDLQGFQALKAILECAPLPGGRTDLYDAEEEDDNEQENTTPLMMGVRPLDYKLWKTNPQAAMASWRTWQSQIETVGVFLQREPRLMPILQILRGDFSSTVFEDWSEALCAELLYVRPNLRMEDLPIRMARVMQSFGEGQTVLLSILEGDYGQIVESLYKDLGGGSGAALPATMTSLICNLLMDAKLLPESGRDLQTDLLLAASDAILSSHTNTDMGMRLVALLLVPHCSSKKDLRITATLAEALERHCPQTDAETHVLLDLVRPLVETKQSVRILDGCVSMIVARYRRTNPSPVADANKSMEWLLTGKELEDSLMDQGVCYRLIVSASLEMSHGLLQLLVGKEVGGDGTTTSAAQGVVQALQEKMGDVDAVRLLCCMTTIAVAVVEKQDDRNIVAAQHLAKCLRGLAPPSMHWDLLKLATGILDHDEERYASGSANKFGSSFSVQDMHALMERYTHLTTVDDKTVEDDDLMKLALAKGLMRAIIADNAQRKEIHRNPTTDASTLCSTRIESYSPADQELLVSKMLDL